MKHIIKEIITKESPIHFYTIVQHISNLGIVDEKDNKWLTELDKTLFKMTYDGEIEMFYKNGKQFFQLNTG